MKKLFAVLLVCMLALTGAALAETEESEATPYVSGLGYTIGLPEGWMVLDQAAYDASVDEGLAGVLAEAGITAETLPTLLEEGGGVLHQRGFFDGLCPRKETGAGDGRRGRACAPARCL